MSARNRTLRSVLSWATLLLAVPSVGAAFAIVSLTSLLHRASTAIETSTESVRAAEEGQIALLLHAQAANRIVRRNLAGDVQRRLSEAEIYAQTDPERLLVEEARNRVQHYILASRDAGRPAEEVEAFHAAAFSALEDLVQVNLQQAREEVSQTARIDYLANIGGLALVLLVLGVSGFFIYWVRGPLVRPLVELVQTMDRFGAGEHELRARIQGPRELSAMAERFNEMAAQIERQRVRQRAFLAGIAHDLRTPLAVLASSTDVALADDSLPAEHRVRRALEGNARQLRSLDRMISDLLDAAAIQAGRLELRVELGDLREVVGSTAELFEGGMSSQHEMVLYLPPDPVELRMDALRMEQVTSNLISNAIKYSPEGGRVEVRLERRGAELVLSVTDEGIGMSPQTQKSAFEPFARASLQDRVPGVGLGLFVVQRIVVAHGGRIEVESAVGAGSTFHVFLPHDVSGAARSW